jgi:hypothetical protein
MIWKTTNGLGQEVTWYSEDEVKHLNDLLNQALKELEELQEGLANGQETS